ncbi:hypothetical protein CesoFtcFv8_007828 [Champsocephalus esox]|uniref:Secreted protein n=2 Tax=Channichthyidae TaxID=30806 RepID=A0AAN8H4Y9_9TELE|nr:hypothetical protein KUCAC02_021567 [Chaenocephalus aceratus]KAK5902588.1 hypothetical protein CesoFtcFv8_007828 [Champsocephalus esox]
MQLGRVQAVLALQGVGLVFGSSVQHQSTGQRQARGRGGAQWTELLGEPHPVSWSGGSLPQSCSRPVEPAVHARSRSIPSCMTQIRSQLGVLIE